LKHCQFRTKEIDDDEDINKKVKNKLSDQYA
jgi:hypothetical protein